MMITEPTSIAIGTPLAENFRDTIVSVAGGHGLDAFEILELPGELRVRFAATSAIGASDERFSEAVAATLVKLHGYFDPTGRRGNAAGVSVASTDEETFRQRMAARYAVLRTMYKMSGGAQKQPIAPQLLVKETTLNFGEVILALEYLKGEGLVESMSIEWDAGLTHHGIKEVEQSLREPTKATEHFLPNVIQNFYGPVGAVVQGAGATVTTAQNSPGSKITVATGSAVIHERLSAAIEAVRRLDAGTAAAFEKLADRVAATPQLTEGAKTEATEALAVVAEQCATTEEKRLPKSVLTPVVMKLRESLSLSADVLQVWTTFGPSIVAWLGVILK